MLHNFQGQKPRLSWSPLWKFQFFLIDRWNFHIIFFQYTPLKKNMSSTFLLVWNFFWNSSFAIAILKLSHKTVIWLFEWNLPVHWDIPEKIQTGGVEDILFWKPLSGIFRFVTLPSEIPEKTSFYPQKFCKIVWHPLEIPRSKTKTHWNSTWIFL